MIGQGRPNGAFRRRCCPRLAAACNILSTLAVLVALPGSAAGGNVDLQLRLEWGGSVARRWQGTVEIDSGTLESPRALGIDADEPGSIWAEDGRVLVRSPSRRAYDGVDVVVRAPPTAALTVQLSSADQAADTSITIALAEVLDEYRSYALDNHGSKLLVRRAPGDKIEVRLARDKVVFAPGETLELDAGPKLPTLPAGTRMRVQARLLPARGVRAIWSGERDVELSGGADDRTPSAHFAIPLPQQEGVYEVVLTAHRRGLQERITRRAGASEERRVQLVVISRDRPFAPPTGPASMDVLVEIDPASPGWSERLTQLAVLPALRRGPLGSGELSTAMHPLGRLARVGPHGHEPEISWQAYPLPVSRPGQPHIVEVEYPDDVPQFLGLSVIEPNAAGAVLPIGLDSGAYVDRPGEQPAQMQKHRLVFWPRTSGPLLLVTNRRDEAQAVFGRIRLLGPRAPLAARMRDPVPQHLPRVGPIAAPDGSRLLAAYYDRPLFAANFGANQGLDPWHAASGRTLSDWSTFYEGGTRLLEYLDYAGFNGLVLSVMADGSTIYPSKLLEPTPRYDDGTLFGNGQDPLRKDSLEMMFRLCDRQGVQLIPAMHFATPLPEIEQLKRFGGGEARGLDLVNTRGISWLEANDPREGLAPYYNPLNPRVQRAMTAAVRELVTRYAEHPSFSGLALQLSADGYAQLPGLDWGCDDDTLVQFTREAALGDAAGPPRELRERLLTPAVKKHWLRWRAEKLAGFYRSLQAEIAATGRGARLYLCGADMLNRPELIDTLKPNLDQPPKVDESLANVGIDPGLYASERGPTILRVSRLAPERPMAQQAAIDAFNQAKELEQVGGAAELFYHEPQEAHVASFDARSPFRPTFSRLVTQALPAGRENCRRFAHALAERDARLMADGGWLLSLGGEDSLHDFVRAYRELPPIAFNPVEGAVQPVVVRTAQTSSRTYVYLVNDSRWPVSAELSVDAPAATRLEQSIGSEQPPPASGKWKLKLKPYGLAMARYSAPGVRFSQPAVELPPEASQLLDKRVRELWARAASLKHPEPQPILANGGFEQPQSGDGTVPDWTLSQRPGARLILDDRKPHGGKRLLHLVTASEGARLTSAPFTPRPTGRLSVSAWLRGSSQTPQAKLRMAVDVLEPGQPEVREQTPDELDAAPLTDGWTQRVFVIRNLPEVPSRMSVRFELVGQGEVSIDDVQVCDVEFNDNERIELSKLIALAEYKRASGEVADCLSILDGYWARFLASYVPESAMPVAEHTEEPAKTAEPSEPERKPGMLDRVRRWMPGWLR